MDLPVIETPVFPRWVWMEEITYSHIPIATLITAFMILAPVYEYIGYRLKDARYDRLARGLIWFAMILFSPGAALGTGIPIFIIGAYPEFWARWSNLFFWPLFWQFIFFLMEVLFLFFGYYLAWDLLAKRKRLHIALGAIAALWGFLVQVVWDALGAYMMTPGQAALPQVDEPVAWSAAAFFNPSFPYLLAHRVFGNFSYTMLLVGGVFALLAMSRKKSEREKSYFAWAANITFTVGVLAFFAQPHIGRLYANVIKENAPVAFAAIMGGHAAGVFTLKMTLIVIFLAIGGVYVFTRYRNHAGFPIAVTVGVLSVLPIIYLHPPLDWVGGSATGWYAVSVGVLLGLLVLMWSARLVQLNPDRRWMRWAMFIAGLASFFTFAFGGFVRERSKSPDTVYGQIAKPEQTPVEVDRYLAYQLLAPTHDGSVSFLDRYQGDWEQLVEEARSHESAPEITDEQAKRIVRFLRENHHR